MTECGDFAEFLRQEARSSTAALHEFRLLYSPSIDSVHLFLEGDDDILYYMPEVRSRAQERAIYPHVCGGKRGVIEARTLVYNEGLSDTKCLFFVDRDYDDLFENQIDVDESTFITESYSIENYLVCEAALEILLVEFGRMSPADPNLMKARAWFQAGRRKFHQSIEPYLAWAIAYRAAGGKPNFNNADLKKVFTVSSDGGVSKRRGATPYFGRAVMGEQREGQPKGNPNVADNAPTARRATTNSRQIRALVLRSLRSQDA